VIGLSQLLGLPGDEERSIEHLARQADFVPETLTGMELLERLRDQSSRMVFVVDEYGEVQGLMTPLDLLQAITGELKSETQTEAWATPRDDGSWLLDGLMPVSELKVRLELDDLPSEARGRYNTLAGLLLLVLGRLPVTGEKIQLQAWEFEVVDLDGRRIDKILARKIAE
jgi:putative hemolysin